jgi:phosphonoacetaldehyde hydrolase
MDGRRSAAIVFGLSREDAAALPPAAFRERREAAAKRLDGVGAHYVIDSVADLIPVALQIEGRLQRGERP